MPTTLLATKLHIPPASPELVIRPRLRSMLDAIVHHKMTLISAPAGYGKTTLISEWAHNVTQLHVVWVSLDKSDNDPILFWQYLVTALQGLKSGVGESSLALLRSPQPPPFESVLTALINDCTDITGDFALVLDDYHMLESQSIHSAMSFLIDHLPHQMHLIIATRADPPLPVARFRGSGMMTEIRADDLRFTIDEGAAFFKEVLGFNLSPNDIAALDKRTEGWIAGLQMAGISMRGRQDIPDFIEAFTGSHRYVLDYLIEEVIQRQPVDVQEFLLKTSILDRLSASLCDVVAERDDSDRMLRTLEQANLFIIRLDESRQWYRYHRLFMDLLRQQMNTTHMKQLIPLLHARASQWYERAGLVSDAVHHAFTGNDINRAATLIFDASEITLKNGEVTTLLGWLKELPDEKVRNHPYLCLNFGWALTLTGQFGAAASYLERASQMVQDTQNDPAFLARLFVAQAYLARSRGDYQRAIELSEKVLSFLPKTEFLQRSLVGLTLGLAYAAIGNLPEAEHALIIANEASLQSGNQYVRLTALSLLSAINLTQGNLHRAEELCTQAIREGQRSSSVALAHIELGTLLYEKNLLEESEHHLYQGIELSRAGGNVDIQSSGYRALARLKCTQRDDAAALDALQKAHQLSRDYDVTPLARASNAACHIEFALNRNDLVTANYWAEQAKVNADVYILNPRLSLICARILLAQNDWETAVIELSEKYETAIRAGWRYVAVEARLLQAMAEVTRDTAITFLADALSLAEPEGYVRTFLDGGEPVARLLREAESRGVATEYIGQLLKAFTSLNYDAAKKTTTTPQTQSLVEPLSERELEVLKLMAAGLSNREIADRLVIGLGTAKTHVHNICAKLDARSRAEAAARARELALI